MADVLVDANFLVAIGYPRDRNHVKAKTFAAIGAHRLLVPDVVLAGLSHQKRSLFCAFLTLPHARYVARSLPAARRGTFGHGGIVWHPLSPRSGERGLGR